MKAVIIVALIFAACVYAQTTCPPKETTCVDLGQVCNATAFCSDSYCNFNGTTGVCTAYIEEKGACNSTTYIQGCAPGLSCIKDACVQPPYAGAGEACSETANCLGSLTCVNAKCTLNTTEGCAVEYDCPAGQYCSAGNCTATKAVGATCASPVECGLDLTCNNDGSNSTCIAAFSLQLNANCTQYGPGAAQYQPCDVTVGLYCNGKTSKCEQFPAPSAEGKTCTTGAECTFFEECVCNGKSNVCAQTTVYTNETLTECKEATQNFYKCMSNNGCTQISNNENSCLSENCQSEYCDMISSCSVEVDAVVPVECSNPDALYVFTCSSATAIQASIMFVLVAAFALLF